MLTCLVGGMFHGGIGGRSAGDSACMASGKLSMIGGAVDISGGGPGRYAFGGAEDATSATRAFSLE